VGSIPPKAGAQPVWPLPAIRPPHSTGMRDRQGSGVHLPPGILGKVPHHGRPQVLKGSPESAHSAVKYTLGRQAREEVAQVAADLGEKAPFAGTPQQVAD